MQARRLGTLRLVTEGILAYLSIPDAICGTSIRNYEPGTYLDSNPLAECREARKS